MNKYPGEIKLKYWLLYLFLSITIFIGLFFNEDSSGSGGYINDFHNTWPINDLIRNKIFFNFSEYTIHFPLHYYIIYILDFLFHGKENVKIFFCIISILLPYLFFRCLEERFNFIDRNNLFLFSQIIFILPAFRSGAIWANSQITSLIFFLLSIYFFIKWKNNKINFLNNYIVLQLLFLSLAVYSRQLYAIIFLYILFVYFLNLKFKEFIKVCVITLFFAIPGFYLVLLSPTTLKTTFDLNFINSSFVNLSIISFYLLPFYFLMDKKYFIKNLENKNNIKVLFVFFLIIFLFSFFFTYNYTLGGGFFIKLSILLFNNLYLFYLTSFAGLLCIFFIYKQSKIDVVLFILLVFGFSSYQIFQKYFEPMLIILFFLMINSKLQTVFLRNVKKIFFYLSYFLIYLITALINDLFKISKILL